MKHKKLIQLGIDIAQGTTGNYSKEESNAKFREALNKLTGSEDGHFDAKAFRRNKTEIFEIIEEVVDARVEEGLKNQFDQFVDVRSVKFGDKLSFLPETDELFEVAEIAGGTNNLNRQRLTHGKPYQVSTGWEGVKIYDELERFLAGYVDWEKLIDKIERSYQQKISEKIFLALQGAYNSIPVPYSTGGTWDAEKFNDVVAHIEAATGLTPLVIGTRKAVRKATPSFVSEKMKDERNAKGYFETIDGITFGVIPQAHKIGTTDFVIDDNVLLILPNGNEKIVKLIFEGQAITNDEGERINADMSKEYSLLKKYGVGVLTSTKFGVYKLA
ncbi:hypothetical protein [Paenibacillus polymyxa]|uniref:hypothetical protein n=1 Tax=Paenibacillus polymyxa TaxID=1406 RepID=UPI002AB43DE3|nr:hypothetical protein [Paenibacillus polymyxa]MDY8023388.1 hypothetical protein [Paenibacillus polymyxa]